MSTLNPNFFSYLLKKKNPLGKLSKSEEKEMWHIAKDFLYSGFLLDSISFGKTNLKLKNKLEIHNKAFFINYLLMKKSLIEIAKTFNEKKISFVVLKGMALNIEKIYKPGIRQHRDIDLLVRKEDIKKAYEILRKLNFRYANSNTSDNASYLFKHHLPPMINKLGITLELHWRVTEIDLFESCPLTNFIFKKKKECNIMKGIFIPNLECLIAHSIYHGIKHHNFDQGPIFLFDLAAIHKFNSYKWPKNENLIKNLGLYEEYKKCKKIISIAHEKNKFSKEVQELIKEVLGNFNWKLKKQEKIKIFSSLKEKNSLKNLLKKISIKINATSHLYQLPKTSFRYWIYFFRDLIISLRRINF